MISFLGFFSLIVFAISVGALLLHFKVIKRRSAADDCLEILDSLLRDRLEILCEIAELSPNPYELQELCEIHAAQDTRKIIKSLPRLHKMAAFILDGFEEPDESEEPEESEEMEIIKVFDVNLLEIRQAIQNYNGELTAYNDMIAVFPGNVMANILGLTPEKEIGPGV